VRRLLQSIIYNRKLYDRPQDEWTCGRAAEGCACIYGPGPKGECRATGQCLPAKKNDRWVCTRAISLGAACEPGPRPDGTCGCPVPPCQPVRSLRSVRGRWVRVAMVAALGIAALAWWNATRMTWANPGPLTNQHAVSAHQCSACHTETPGLLISADARALRAAEHGRLCITCHDLGPHAEAPHGVAIAELLEMTRVRRQATAASPLTLTIARRIQAPETPVCATCHREHQGREFNLAHMPDAQCQSCHQAQFAGFADGHPEFSDYPYTRRTRLNFNHVSHFQKHFADARLPVTAPSSCSQCHEPSINGEKMLVRGFEQACASCHATQIQGTDRAGDKGLVFLRLPDIEVSALEEAGHGVGEWPAFTEGDLTPFMRWLLEGDEGMRAALTALDGVKLSDLRRATPEQKAAAARVLWGVKGLLADLATEGQQVITSRLGAAPIPRAAKSGRAGQFSADVALAAQQKWLPNLLVEVAAYRRGDKVMRARSASPGQSSSAPQVTAGTTAVDADDLLVDLPGENNVAAGPARPPPAPPPELKLAEPDARVAAGGWYRQDDTYALHYRPGDHEDAFLASWIDGTAREAAPTAQRIFTQLTAENAPGVCMKCHSVDQTPAGLVVNWRTSRPQPDVHPFTRFKHDAHFSLMGDQGCMTCHTFNVAADHAGSFGANRDPAKFQSNFAPMAKASCTSCHTPAKSGESCLQCHNYHTGEMKTLRAQAATLPAKIK
jgi:hypothetical protein